MQRTTLAALLVLALARTGAGQATLASFSSHPLLTNPHTLATDGTRLFVGNDDPQQIQSLPITGGMVTSHVTLAKPPNCCFAGMAVAGGYVYWIDPNSGPVTDTQIQRWPLAGGAVSAIYTGSTRGQPIIDGSDLTTDGTWLYTADYVGGWVHRVSLDGATIQQIGGARYGASFANEQHVALAHWRGTLFLCDAGRAGVITPGVRTLPASGGSYATLWQGAPFVNPMAMAVDNGTVFVADGTTIWALPTTGGAPHALLQNASLQGIGDMLALDNVLYIADNGLSGPGRLWRVTWGAEVIGHSCAGLGGFQPELAALGGLAWSGNASFNLEVARGPGGAPAFLLLGFGTFPGGIPLGGGCSSWLDPGAPMLVVPPALALSGAGAGNGVGAWSLPIPAGLLAGATAHLQALILDTGSGNGTLTATAGFTLTILP